MQESNVTIDPGAVYTFEGENCAKCPPTFPYISMVEQESQNKNNTFASRSVFCNIMGQCYETCYNCKIVQNSC